MEQLILHLFGDYISQTDKMAKLKRVSIAWALIHALVYTIPFALITQSFLALLVIFITHAVIDHFGLARYVVFAKNYLTDMSLVWKDCRQTGYPPDTPVWLSTWLLIIADNTLHLIINYLAIRFL